MYLPDLRRQLKHVLACSDSNQSLIKGILALGLETLLLSENSMGGKGRERYIAAVYREHFMQLTRTVTINVVILHLVERDWYKLCCH